MSPWPARPEARAEQLAGRFGIAKVYDDHRALLDDPSIDIVDLCVPNALHLPLVLETIKAGKHVICEKPLTGYFGQGEPDTEVGATPKRTMLDKVRADLAEVSRVMAAHPVKFCYAENWVYAPAVRKALEIVDRYVGTGSILEIRGEESHSGSHSEYSKWWRYAGGGSLARLAAHPIGLGLFLKHYEGGKKTGRPIVPVEVLADGVDLTKTPAFASAKGSPLVTGWKDVETWAQVTVTFSDGTRGIFYGTDDLLGGMEGNVDIRLTNARLKLDIVSGAAVPVLHHRSGPRAGCLLQREAGDEGRPLLPEPGRGVDAGLPPRDPGFHGGGRLRSGAALRPRIGQAGGRGGLRGLRLHRRAAEGRSVVDR